MTGWLRRRLLAAAAMIVCAGLSMVGQAPIASAASGGGHAQIKGSGSSWAAVAIQQWISDAQQQQHLQVVFSPNGSESGRADFANGVTDFAVSDIGYQGVDPQTGITDRSSRPYAYLPIVGGGTAFPYHIEVRGQEVKTLRLSQLTLAKIFTNQITNWDDPEITKDNNGVGLPSIPIIPVVHSEGAGTTYQLTDWLSREFPSEWKSFSGLTTPIEEWPSDKGNQHPESGSDAVISFIASSAGEGSIGFDEYAYALQQDLPVANLENAAGYFVPPDQYNVAVALTQAQINTDKSTNTAGAGARCLQLGYPTAPCYLLENLHNVWEYTDPRTYPLSSYSYLVEPTSSSDEVKTLQRQTIVDYASLALCGGQGEVGPIGYSPLPVNLVQDAFAQLDVLHTADPNVSVQSINIAQCHNPTFDPSNLNINRLAQIAPQPPLCAKVGNGPCDVGVGLALQNPTPNGQVQSNSNGAGAGTSPGSGPSGSGPSGSGASGASGSGASGTGAPGGGSTGRSASAQGASAVKTGASAATAAGGATSPGGQSGAAVSASEQSTTTEPVRLQATTLGASRPGGDGIEILVAVLILAVLAVPPVVTRIVRRRLGKHTAGEAA